VFYRAYGLTIASAMPLPELASTPAPGARAATAAPDIAIDLATGPVDEAAWTTLPSSEDDSPWLSVSRRLGAHRLRFEDGGTFVVWDGGRRITVQLRTTDLTDTLRHLLIDQVIPLALSHLGQIVLHAGAVVEKDAAGNAAVAFIGPAGAGKSTLTASLASTGCALLADDALVVAVAGSELLATPAYPGVRLWPDVAPSVGGSGRHDIDGLPRVAEYTEKRRIGIAGGWLFIEGRVPLRRVYVLETSEDDRVSVGRVGPRDAIVALLSHTYVLDVSDRARLAAQFARICAASPAAEVRRLSYPRALDRLPDVHAAIREDLRQP
jgi:hypothetical protein